MDLDVLNLACLYAIDVCEVNVLYKVVCAFVLLVYVRCSLGERQRWRVWLGNQNTRGFGRQARQDKPPYELPLVPPRGPFPLFQVNPFLPFLQGRRTNFVFAAANKFLICCSLVSYLLFLSPLKLSLRSTFVSPQALSRCTALHCNKETLKKEKAFLSRAGVQLLCIALQLLFTALHYFALLCTVLHCFACPDLLLLFGHRNMHKVSTLLTASALHYLQGITLFAKYCFTRNAF